MKKQVITALVIFLNSFIIEAQVILEQNDFPSAGDTLRFSYASPEQITIYQEAGEDYFWDFSELNHIEQGLEEYKFATQINTYLGYVYGLQSFARSITDIVEIEVFDGFDEFEWFEELEDIYQVFNKSSTEFTYDGFVFILFSVPVPFIFSDKDELYQFPLNYERRDSTTFEGSLALEDSIYIQTRGYRINEADGWGQIITPYGEFDCLRIKTTLHQYDSLYYEQIPESIVLERTTIEYKWLAKNEKIPVMEITTIVNDDKSETIIMARYRDVFRPDIEAPIADFSVSESEVFINELVYFENLSTPDHVNNEYFWEFFTEDIVFHEGTDEYSIEPIVSFSLEGLYNAQLTATNSSGSDVVLKTGYIKVEQQPNYIEKTNDVLFIYPNPFENNIYIKSQDSYSFIKIYSINGLKLLEKEVQFGNTIKFDLSFLKDGVYLVLLGNDKAKVQKTIIKRGHHK